MNCEVALDRGKTRESSSEGTPRAFQTLDGERLGILEDEVHEEEVVGCKLPVNAIQHR
jgi:hypothetical protein